MLRVVRSVLRQVDLEEHARECFWNAIVGDAMPVEKEEDCVEIEIEAVKC